MAIYSFDVPAMVTEKHERYRTQQIEDALLIYTSNASKELAWKHSNIGEEKVIQMQLEMPNAWCNFTSMLHLSRQ